MGTMEAEAAGPLPGGDVREQVIGEWTTRPNLDSTPRRQAAVAAVPRHGRRRCQKYEYIAISGGRAGLECPPRPTT